MLPQTPVRVEYALTDEGAGLAGAIDALSAWAERWATVGTEGAPLGRTLGERAHVS